MSGRADREGCVSSGKGCTLRRETSCGGRRSAWKSGSALQLNLLVGIHTSSFARISQHYWFLPPLPAVPSP